VRGTTASLQGFLYSGPSNVRGTTSTLQAAFRRGPAREGDTRRSFGAFGGPDTRGGNRDSSRHSKGPAANLPSPQLGRTAGTPTVWGKLKLSILESVRLRRSPDGSGEAFLHAPRSWRKNRRSPNQAWDEEFGRGPAQRGIQVTEVISIDWQNPKHHAQAATKRTLDSH